MSKGKKRSAVLLALFIITILLMTSQHGRKSFPLLEVFSYPFYFLNKITSSLTSSFKDTWNSAEENKTLKKEVTQLLYERQQYAEIILENRRLKELLSLKEHERRYVTSAKIVSRGYDRFLNTIIIDKGTASGIEKGMAVITTKGLVGKVYSAKGDFSDILLLRDTNFSVAVRLQNSRREGVVSGTGNERCTLKYIPPEENVEKGELVFTSGIDGIFPAGLPVGVVHSVKKEGVEFFQQIEVLPFQSDSKLDEIVILRKETSGN